MLQVSDVVWIDVENHSWLLVSGDENNLGIIEDINIMPVVSLLKEEVRERA